MRFKGIGRTGILVRVNISSDIWAEPCLRHAMTGRPGRWLQNFRRTMLNIAPEKLKVEVIQGTIHTEIGGCFGLLL